jgi:glycosyltransferase involved in cell wall biosynthesis
LDSILIQTYKDFEVIISDDSDDDSVRNLVKEYGSKMLLAYYKNDVSLGTPSNWNFAISKATGEWIKLIHDDDWFSSAESLAIFADQTRSGNKFIFSAYTNVYEEEGREPGNIELSALQKKSIEQNPDVLLLTNLIGPPSVALIHHTIAQEYDTTLKWRVDSELYTRVLKQNVSFSYIKRPLISIGISESQVTQTCANNPAIEIPEAYILIQKHGIKSLKNIRIYDSWWRLLRNMHIVNEKKLRQYVDQEWPPVIVSISKDLAKAPALIFKNGVFSKIFMTLSYLRNKSKL